MTPPSPKIAASRRAMLVKEIVTSSHTQQAINYYPHTVYTVSPLFMGENEHLGRSERLGQSSIFQINGELGCRKERVHVRFIWNGASTAIRLLSHLVVQYTYIYTRVPKSRATKVGRQSMSSSIPLPEGQQHPITFPSIWSRSGGECSERK